MITFVTTGTGMTALNKFIEAEIAKREMTITAFAKFCGISKTQMINVLNEKRQPGLEFLIKLSKATGINLSKLVNLVHPEEEAPYKPNTVVLAELYEQLPADKQKIVDNIMNTLLADELFDEE